MALLEFNGKKLDLTRPVVMGILNLTPDSFYDGGKYPDLSTRIRQVGRMLEEGASIIDIGAVSTRPGAAEVDEEEEMLRIMPVLQSILKAFPGCLISVDTFRAPIAKLAIENGAFMINDIFGGVYDPGMIPLIAKFNIPCVIMHMKGTPQDMQNDPQYGDVMAEISYFFDVQIKKFESLGARQLIIDPGFGFGKTVKHNFEILSRFPELLLHEVPVLVGFSRKSMINRVLGTSPADAMNGTTVLNTIALLKGASILRVHDVKEAVEAVVLTEAVR